MSDVLPNNNGWVCPFCGSSDIDLIGRPDDLLYQCNLCNALAEASAWCDWNKQRQVWIDVRAQLDAAKAEIERLQGGGVVWHRILDEQDAPRLREMKLVQFRCDTTPTLAYLRKYENWTGSKGVCWEHAFGSHQGAHSFDSALVWADLPASYEEASQ